MFRRYGAFAWPGGYPIAYLMIDGERREAIITVGSVQERLQGHATGKRRWEVCSADYPWWWGVVGIMGYADSRIDLAEVGISFFPLRIDPELSWVILMGV